MAGNNACKGDRLVARGEQSERRLFVGGGLRSTRCDDRTDVKQTRAGHRPAPTGKMNYCSVVGANNNSPFRGKNRLLRSIIFALMALHICVALIFGLPIEVTAWDISWFTDHNQAHYWYTETGVPLENVSTTSSGFPPGPYSGNYSYQAYDTLPFSQTEYVFFVSSSDNVRMFWSNTSNMIYGYGSGSDTHQWVKDEFNVIPGKTFTYTFPILGTNNYPFFYLGDVTVPGLNHAFLEWELPQKPVINSFSGPASTTSANVTLNLSASDNTSVGRYIVIEAPSEPAMPTTNDPGWKPITAAANVTVPVNISLTVPGDHSFHAWVMDNFSQISNAASFTVNYNPPDTEPPNGTVTHLAPGGDPAWARSFLLRLNLSATDNVGVTHWYASTDNPAEPSGVTPGWKAFDSPGPSVNVTQVYALTDRTEGLHTIRVWFKDAMDNVSAVSSLSVTLDSEMPMISSFQSAVTTVSTNREPYGLFVSIIGELWYCGRENSRGIVRRFNLGGGSTTVTSQLNAPADMMIDATGNILVADMPENRIRKIDINGLVTDFAGSTRGDNDGSLTTCQFDGPYSIISYNGSYYVAEYNNHKIKVINGSTVTTFSGNGMAGSDIGDPVTTSFNKPSRLEVHDVEGFLVGDIRNYSIRYVDKNGNTQIFSGDGVAGLTDGSYDRARFNYPAGIAIDSYGTVYVSDGTGSQRGYVFVVSPNGYKRRIAGSGAGFVDGDGMSTARFKLLGDVEVNKNTRDLYVADNNNDAIRKIVLRTKTGLFVNGGAKLTTQNNFVIHLYATDNRGVTAYLVKQSGNTPESPPLTDPGWVAEDFAGGTKTVNLFLSSPDDGDGWKVFWAWFRDAAGNVSFVTTAEIQLDQNPPVDLIAGSVNFNNASIRTVNGNHFLTTREVFLDLTGNGNFAAQINGWLLKDQDAAAPLPSLPSSSDIGWQLITPPVSSWSQTVAYSMRDSGDGTKTVYLYLRDIGGNVSPMPASYYTASAVLDTTGPTGTVVINNGDEWTNRRQVTLHLEAADAIGVTAYFPSYRWRDDVNADTPGWLEFPTPDTSVTLDTTFMLPTENGERSVYVWFKDGAGNTTASPVEDMIKLDTVGPVNGTEEVWVSTYAGSGPTGLDQGGRVDGPIETAKFQHPLSLVIDDSDTIFVADYHGQYIRRIRNGQVDTIAGSGNLGYLDGPALNAKFKYPTFITLLGSKIIVTEANSGSVRYVDNDTVGTFAGYGQEGFFNGPVNVAKFKYTQGAVSLHDGSVVVCDVYNQCLRKIDTHGVVTTFAGDRNQGSDDGDLLSASFYYPVGPTIDTSGIIYVCDSMNYTIRRIDKGKVTLFAGSLIQGYKDGQRLQAEFGRLHDTYIDNNGNIFVAESWNYRIRKILPSGFVKTIIGNGNPGLTDGWGLTAQLNHAGGMAKDSKGNLYIGDSYNQRIRKAVFSESGGLLINNGDPHTYSANVPLQLTSEDNYSGITHYCVSEDPTPPNTSDGRWTPIPVAPTTPVATFEVSFTLSTISEPVTLHCWFKDRAGNVSSRCSRMVNPKRLKAVETIGDSTLLTRPKQVALSDSAEIHVLDASTPPLARFDNPTTVTRLGRTGVDRDGLDATPAGFALRQDGGFVVAEPDKHRLSFWNAGLGLENALERSIDLSANYHGLATSAEIALKVNDKYTSADFTKPAVILQPSQTAGAPLDINFVARTVEVFVDSAYTELATEPVCIKFNPVVYVQVTGLDGDSAAINSIILQVANEASIQPLALNLLETSSSSGIYRGSFRIGEITNLNTAQIAVAEKTNLNLTVREFTARYPVDGRWVLLGDQSIFPENGGTIYELMKHDGKLYMACGVGGGPGVFVFDGNSWSPVGASPCINKSPSYLSLVGTGGKIYLAFSNRDNGGQAQVVCYDGSGWNVVGNPAITTYYAYYNSLAEFKGEIYLANSDYKGDQRVSVYKFDGVANWSFVGSENVSDDRGHWVRLETTSDRLLLSYRDDVSGNAGRPTMKCWDGSSWSLFANRRFTGSQADCVNCDVYDNQVYVCFVGWGTNGKNPTVVKHNGAQFQYFGPRGFTKDNAYSLSIAVDKQDVYVSYQFGQTKPVLQVKKFYQDKQNWIQVGGILPGKTVYSGNNCGACNSMVVYEGSPVVAYSADSEGRRPRVMIYRFK